MQNLLIDNKDVHHPDVLDNMQGVNHKQKIFVLHISMFSIRIMIRLFLFF